MMRETAGRSIVRHRGARGLAALVACALIATGCSRGGDDPNSTESSTSIPVTTTTVTEPGVTINGEPIKSGQSTTTEPPAPLEITLSDGGDAPIEPVAVEVVPGDPLESDAVVAALDRLHDWDVPVADTEDLNLPPQTLPPPLVGDTVEEAFPPADEDMPTPDPVGGPLHLIRYQPEGGVDVAPFITVTFDQPMIPVATLDELDATDVPVTVDPPIDGRWRWIGTRTLRFEVEPGLTDRLPAATFYSVEVPAGTTSVSGGRLDETVSWQFATPAPTITQFVGASTSMSTTPVFVAVFDQLIDPTAVLTAVTVEAAGQAVTVRLATADEVAADEAATSAVDAALEQRWVAFTPDVPLPVDTEIHIEVGPHVPSAEGPLTSDSVAEYDARTFGALMVESSRCGYGDGCRPGVPFFIEFNNVLDPDAFTADLLSVTPAVPGLQIDVNGSVIQLAGETGGQTDYTVMLDGSLRDVFGQTLADDVELTFEVGAARPWLRGLDQEWITVDPMSDTPSVEITTVNHDEVHVSVWGVDPGDVSEYRRFKYDEIEDPPEGWSLPIEFDVAIENIADQVIVTEIDLSDAFRLAGSQVVVMIESTLDIDPDDDDYWANQPSVAWVQQTTLGLSAFLNDDQMVIWTTDLVTGKPVENVPVELIGDGRVATTDEHGLATISFGDRPIVGLWANAGDRIAFLASDWWDGWESQTRADEGRWYIFDDRGIYRPGDTVNVTGWVRKLDWSNDAQLALYGPDTTIRYTAYDPQGAELESGDITPNALGGFNLSLDLPAEANLGSSWIEFNLDDSNAESPSGESAYAQHSFEIQEFRRPEFEVTTGTTSAGPFFSSEPATVSVDANYYAGGPLADAEVNWLISNRSTTYAPPNWDEFTFGIWTPWWYDVGYASLDCWDCFPEGETTEYETFSGRTNADGTHRLDLAFSNPAVDLPSSVSAEATVTDVNRQAWSSRVDLLVHAAKDYVGLLAQSPYVTKGEPIVIDTVVTDVDGGLVADRAVEVSAGRVEYALNDGVWAESVVDPQVCEIESSDAPDEAARAAAMRCSFTTEVGGRYRVTAIVTDADGNQNRSERTVWVSGATSISNQTVDRDEVTIVPNAETYAPGDTAELLIQAPFAPAEGIITVMHAGITSTESFEAADGSAILEVVIGEGDLPNVTVQVETVGTAPRDDIAAERPEDSTDTSDEVALRPAYASGRVSLSVPPVSRTLQVTATPADAAVEPGDDTSVSVEVLGADGEPVAGADVAVVVVDEAVLALTGYELSDPVDVFYQPIYEELQARYTRATIALSETRVPQPQRTDTDYAGDATDDADDGAGLAPESADQETSSGERTASSNNSTVDIRTNFEALAVYAPNESTDADGMVTVDVPLPDSLTKYRVMAVAISADQFGKAESSITARLPLMVRPSAPRFLNFGDAFDMPVVLQNQTDTDLAVDVVLEVDNLELGDVAGKRVTVPANDRIEVRFPVSTQAVGTARYRVIAVSDEFADAAEGQLPVYTPATAEAFATYGVVDGGGDFGPISIEQSITAPTGVFPQFGGLEVGTSATAIQALTDAVIYLTDYRYESADGLASRIMAISALRDVLDAFEAEGLPTVAELNAQIDGDIDKLKGLQNADGGFSYWQRNRPSIPWVSAQVAHALLLAQNAGYTVPAPMTADALEYLRSVEQHFPSWYDPAERNAISAYALFVRKLAGDPDIERATALYTKAGDDLQIDALAWLWGTITDDAIRTEIETRIINSAVDTPGAATFATDYGEDGYLIANSTRRTDGVVLDALISETPDSDLIPKVVAGLMAGQTRGRWNNANENAFILLALQRYFTTFETTTPDFIARAWLGEQYVLEHTFEGRTTDRVSTLVPMDTLITAGDSNVIVQNDGVGRLYYRLGLRYAPSDLMLDARDEGFVVERRYEAVGDPADVTQDENGTWHVRAGATVRVTLTMVADARRTHMALIDPLPAGFEAVNPALAVSQTFVDPELLDESGDETADDFAAADTSWWWQWFDHQNLRDDRVEAFASILSGGTYEYSYVARATTPGDFIAPPARAEEIYAPEVFGRSASALVVIE